jgi:hypothetical protein
MWKVAPRGSTWPNLGFWVNSHPIPATYRCLRRRGRAGCSRLNRAHLPSALAPGLVGSSRMAVSPGPDCKTVGIGVAAQPDTGMVGTEPAPSRRASSRSDRPRREECISSASSLFLPATERPQAVMGTKPPINNDPDPNSLARQHPHYHRLRPPQVRRAVLAKLDPTPAAEPVAAPRPFVPTALARWKTRRRQVRRICSRSA